MSDMAVVWAPSFPAGKIAALGLNSFSTVPTIPEINASSDWRQIFALYKRRAHQIYTTPPTAVLATAGAAKTPTAASVNALRTAINTMRVDIGMSAFSFGSALATGGAIRAHDITDLRDALNLTGSFSISQISGFLGGWHDSPFGTHASSSSSVEGNPEQVGYDGGARTRVGASYDISTVNWAVISAAVTVTVGMLIGSVSTSTLAECFASNMDDSAGTGTWWNNLDVACDDEPIAPGDTLVTWTIPVSVLAGRAGGVLSLIFGQALEMNNIGVVATFNKTMLLGHLAMHVDLGF